MKGFTLVGFLGRGGLAVFPKDQGKKNKKKTLVGGDDHKRPKIECEILCTRALVQTFLKSSKQHNLVPSTDLSSSTT
jgi:hypothetical protein